MSCLSEAIVDAPLVNVISLFGEIDMFKDWFPKVTECGILKQVTNYRGLYYCQQGLGWPMWPRDMIFTETGIADKKNKAILVVLRSLESNSQYFQTPAP